MVVNMTQRMWDEVQQSRVRETVDAGNPEAKKSSQGRGFAVYGPGPHGNHLLYFLRCLCIVPRYAQRVPHLVSVFDVGDRGLSIGHGE
jgi:hypothetical protein